MNAPDTIPYVSLRDIVVPTLDGYALRFVAGEPIQVPNFKNTIAAVAAAGCVPADEVKVRVKTSTIEEVSETAMLARADEVVAAIGALVAEGSAINFNRAGQPQVRSLEKILGYDITPAERDAAWKTFQAQKNAE